MTKLFDLTTAKADVQKTWEKNGFKATTDEERLIRQLAHPHVEQCQCRFCQSVTLLGEDAG